MATSAATSAAALLAVLLSLSLASAGDNNPVFSPCADTKVQRYDGFTFGIAFSSRDSFYKNNNQSLQLSPCDKQLSLSNGQLTVFRPKVDEISLLTINTTVNPAVATSGGYMVAFAGRKYAARSRPAFVGDGSHIITSFTLVLEFHKGTLQNLYWKTDSCKSCSGGFVCINNLGCAIKTPSCKFNGGTQDCSLGIQLAFSGTDKHNAVLNSWYEVSNLQQYSLFGLYSNLKDTLTGQYNKIF